MNLFDIFAKISIDTSEYEKGLDSASGLTQSFGDKAKAAFGAITKVGGIALTAASAAVVAFGKSSIDAGQQFDSSMAQVAATMGKTVDEVKDLRDFAMEMGAKTAFSASQAADALNYMALAGYDAETSMKTLPSVLNLAAAGTMDLASASDMITDSLSALGLESEDATKLVDQMASASSHANASVSQMGSAILTVGGTAKVLSGGMMTLSNGEKQAYSATTELNQAIGLLADNGVKGSEGGTALRNIILSLTAPTDKAAKTLKSLSVTVLDSSGNMRSMKDIFTDLNKAMSSMSEGKKTEVLNEIFNKTDLKSVNALLGTSVERWDELAASIENSKYAAEKMAKVQLDNLAGDVTLWGSALEGAQIMVSDMLTPSLREFVQLGTSGLTAVTDAFNNTKAAHGLVESIREAGDFSKETFLQMRRDMESLSEDTAEAQLAAAQSAGFDTWDSYKQDFENYAATVKSGVTDIYSQFQGLAAVMASGISLEQFNTEIYSVGDTVDQLYSYLKDKPEEFQDYFSETVLGLSDGWNEFCDIAAQGADDLDWKVKDVLDSVYAKLNAEDSIAKSLLSEEDYAELHNLIDGTEEDVLALYEAVGNVDPSEIQSPFTAAMEALPGMINDAVGMIMEGIPRVVEIGGQILGALVEGIVTNLPVLAEGMVQLVESMGTALIEAAPSMAEQGAQLLQFIMDGFTETLPTLAERAAELAPVLAEGLATGIPAAAEGITVAVESLAATIGESTGSFIDSGLEIVQGLVEGIINGVPKLTESAVNLMVSFGKYLKDNLPALLESGLDMVESLADSIRENAGKLVDGGLELLKNLAQGFADSIPTLIEHVPTIISNIAGVINDNAPKILAAGVNIIITLAGGVIKAIPTLIAEFPKIIKAIYDVFTAFNWLALGGKVVTLIKNGVNALKTAIPNTFKSIMEQARNFIRNVDWAGTGKSILTLLKNGILSLKDAIPATLKNIATTAVSWFKSVDWAGVGKAVINGLISGIVSMGKAAVDALIGVGKSMLDGFKGFFGIASPSKVFAWVGRMVDEGFAKGIEDNADKVESEAAKLAKNVYSAVTTEAERQIKYERLSLTEQLELWETILDQFTEGTDQWWSAYDKVFDLREKVLDEQTKAIEEEVKAQEQALKDSFSDLSDWISRRTKYADASYTEQIRMWGKALDSFAADSEQYAEIEEKLFDLRLSAYQNYADSVEEIAGNMADIQKTYDDAVRKRTEEIANSYKLFDEIPEKQEVSGEELLNNLIGQIRSIKTFYGNLEKLQERGMSAAVVEEIRAMGVSASDELEAILNLSDRHFKLYADLYEEKQAYANSVALSELEELGTQTAGELQEQMDALRTLYDENAPTLGESFAEGLAQGIRNGLADVSEAAVEVAQAALAKTREILGIGNPEPTYSGGASASFPAYSAPYLSGALTEAASTSSAAGTSYASGNAVYQQPLQIVVRVDPQVVNVDGTPLVRILYPEIVQEAHRRGDQLFVTT